MNRNVRYVFSEGKIVEKSKAKPKYDINCFGRGPMVVGDEIPARYCDATGRTYTSRSQMYRDIKDSGSVMVGNDYSPSVPEHHSTIGEVERDVKTSYEELKAGNYQYLNEEDREACRQINEQLKPK